MQTSTSSCFFFACFLPKRSLSPLSSPRAGVVHLDIAIGFMTSRMDGLLSLSPMYVAIGRHVDENRDSICFYPGLALRGFHGQV